MYRTTLSILALAVTLAGAPPAEAGDPRASFVTENRFREALRGEQWREALVLYATLDDASRTPRLTYLAAQAHVRLGEQRLAAELLTGLLERRADNLEALYLLAKVRARQGKLELAKGLLLEAARAGQLVTRDIAYGEGKELFGELEKDPRFVLALMRSSQDTQIDVRGLRNPFRPPPRDGKVKRKEPLRPQPASEVAKRLEREIDALLDQLAVHAEQEELEPLLTKLSELRGLLAEYRELGIAAAQSRLKVFRRKHRRLEDLAASIQLQVDVAAGNMHLKAMSSRYAQGEYAQVIATSAKLEALCARMRKQPREVFARNARALWERGRRLRDAAQVQVVIAALDLKLTGIVIPPDGPGKAIVNDRVAAQGDPVYDPKSLEERPELVLVKVEPGRATFRYRGVTFIRPLDRPDPRAERH